VKSRSHELHHFTNILKSKTNSKLTHQLLPKHMRRRAMAHNHYRIPVKIRLQCLNELKGSETPESLKRSKCRKHRRKLKYLLHLHEIRQRKYRWMETHVWHAKRFKMLSLPWNGGLRVPINCNDKSTRSIYKLCQKESCCIMDQSYFSHFWLSKIDFDNALNNKTQNLKLQIKNQG
jgi:ribonuclease P/MRP protein subunit POP1